MDNEYSNRNNNYPNNISHSSNYNSLPHAQIVFPQNQFHLNQHNQSLNQVNLSDNSNHQISNGNYCIIPNNNDISSDYPSSMNVAFKNSILTSPIGYHDNNHYDNQSDNNLNINEQLNTSFNYALIHGIPTSNSSSLINGNQNATSSGQSVIPSTSLLNHTSLSSFHHPSIYQNERRNNHQIHNNQIYENFDLATHYRSNSNTNDTNRLNEGNFNHLINFYY